MALFHELRECQTNKTFSAWCFRDFLDVKNSWNYAELSFNSLAMLGFTRDLVYFLCNHLFTCHGVMDPPPKKKHNLTPWIDVDFSPWGLRAEPIFGGDDDLDPNEIGISRNFLAKRATSKNLSTEWYGCFLKWWYPQNTPKWSFLVGKPMVVEYHHLRNPPYGTNFTCSLGWIFLCKNIWFIGEIFLCFCNFEMDTRNLKNRYPKWWAFGKCISPQIWRHFGYLYYIC